MLIIRERCSGGPPTSGRKDQRQAQAEQGERHDQIANAQQKPIVGLITKTNTNPFFVKMREGAEAKAKELGVDLRSFAGKVDGDNQTQVEAVETLIAAGAKGILITASDTKAIVPTIAKARAAGILVIALDTPLEPVNAADATFATDNFKAGELIGAWAKATMGDAAKDAKIALLDLNKSQPSVDVARNQGFLKGFGIDLGDPKKIGDEKDPRIVGNDVTNGNEEGGRKAMENLLQKNPGVNVVYTISPRGRQGQGRPDRVGRWRLPRCQERQVRRHRRDLHAVPAADGFDGRGSRGGICQNGQETCGDARPRFLQHRRGTDHGQTGSWHARAQR
jgi:ABC-type sugar transport system substrate-binding protein